jgi:hypothetical protein
VAFPAKFTPRNSFLHRYIANQACADVGVQVVYYENPLGVRVGVDRVMNMPAEIDIRARGSQCGRDDPEGPRSFTA